MKLQPFSGLHADVATVKKITIADDVDAAIVPGDTCEGALRAFEHLRKIVPLHVPIVMTRILCNPHGYGSKNAEFNDAMVVELEA